MKLLKETDPEKIKLLVSDGAREAYKQGFVTFEKLAKETDPEKIKVLVSNSAIEEYKKGTIKFEELRTYDRKKIALLFSTEARKAYENGANISDLKQYTTEEIERFISEEAIAQYKAGKTVHDLARDDWNGPQLYKMW